MYYYGAGRSVLGGGHQTSPGELDKGSRRHDFLEHFRHLFQITSYSPPEVDRKWLWVYYDKIPIYTIFYLLKGGDYIWRSPRSFIPTDKPKTVNCVLPVWLYVRLQNHRLAVRRE